MTDFYRDGSLGFWVFLLQYTNYFKKDRSTQEMIKHFSVAPCKHYFVQTNSQILFIGQRLFLSKVNCCKQNPKLFPV